MQTRTAVCPPSLYTHARVHTHFFPILNPYNLTKPRGSAVLQVRVSSRSRQAAALGWVIRLDGRHAGYNKHRGTL